MAIRAGRVGVRPDQVDHYGRLKATEWLVEQLRDLLETNDAEISANMIARQELERLGLDETIIQKPIVTPIKPVDETEVFPGENLEEVEVAEDGDKS